MLVGVILGLLSEIVSLLAGMALRRTRYPSANLVFFFVTTATEQGPYAPFRAKRFWPELFVAHKHTYSTENAYLCSLFTCGPDTHTMTYNPSRPEAKP